MVPDCSGSVGRAVPAARSLTFEKRAQWDEHAERGLARALGTYAQDIRDGVNAGRMELWRIDAGRAWMVTEVRGDTLICWCYEGDGALEMGETLIRIARRNALEVVEFETPHAALGRMVRRLGFELVAVDDEGLQRYQVTL